MSKIIEDVHCRFLSIGRLASFGNRKEDIGINDTESQDGSSEEQKYSGKGDSA
ncbi:hypothetical protein [Planococcus antarcticus]|uniref:hypothetical protein n=1 Tax=Planococcus antarcticus TaxID=161360 RepID=UPI0012B59637|nr:hypothetical protein [Planococcus antarcticus]